MTPTDKIEDWLSKKEKLYTSVIPGVMDSTELGDMRKLIAIVRFYKLEYEDLLETYRERSHRETCEKTMRSCFCSDIKNLVEAKAQEIINER